MSGAGAVEAAAAVLGARARRDVPLGPLTTYRVGGPAALLVEAGDLGDLGAVVEAVRAAPEVEVLVVGRGSNLLVADAGFDGLVVTLGEGFDWIDLPDGASSTTPEGAAVAVRAGGATSLPVLARRTAAAGLRGFEWAVGVPGSVGGAVRMNAGGHGSDMAACLASASVVRLRPGPERPPGAGEPGPERPPGAGEPGPERPPGAGEPGPERPPGAGEPGPERPVEVPRDELHLGYRRSTIGPTDVVVAAELRLRPGDAGAAQSEVSAIVRWRREHQPGGPNAGSVFSNPPSAPAGRLIEEAGLKGFRHGSAAVSTKHANFIQADEGGSADDVRALMVVIRERVALATGIWLEPEVRLVGFVDQP